jgi:Fic-DOC domain mobile mystery protein B
MCPHNIPNGNTPLTPEELDDLIPNLATKEELNEWERANILEARQWALLDRNVKTLDPVTDDYIRKLHLRMFDQTWKWAGTYRNTEKNIGVPVSQVRERLGTLIGDVRYWIENSTHSPDEIAVRFHHGLVFIHLFPNGNGRHARLIADVLAVRLERPEFTWRQRDLMKPGEAREKYLQAVRAADRNDIKPLLEFARS